MLHALDSLDQRITATPRVRSAGAAARKDGGLSEHRRESNVLVYWIPTPTDTEPGSR